MSKPEPTDDDLLLKKRARRRLLGAVAFAGLAAVVLPMVMDDAPKQQIQDIQIRIPGQDQTAFVPKIEPSPSSQSVTAGMSANVSEKPAEPSSEKRAEKSAGKAADKTSEKPAETAADKTALVKKSAEKPTEKKAEKPADKPTDKPVEKPVEKKAEPPKAEQQAEKTSRTAKRTPAEEAQRAAAILAGKDVDALDRVERAGEKVRDKSQDKAGEKASKKNGQYVIQIGTFSNAANVKQLQDKLGPLGIKVFTESLDSSAGKKTRVRAGPFASRDAAEKAVEKMKQVGVNGVISGKP